MTWLCHSPIAMGEARRKLRAAATEDAERRDVRCHAERGNEGTVCGMPGGEGW